MDRNRSRGQAGTPPAAAGPGAAGVDPAEFAEYLRAERERRRLTLQQVAEETKISSRHLAALERGDVRNWPGGMYRRAMMRAYAESIGVDREFALKQFEQAFEPPEKPEPAPPASPPRRRLPAWQPTRRHRVAAGAALLGVAAVALVWSVAGSPVPEDTGIESAGHVLAAPAPEVQAQPIRRDALEPPVVAAAAPAVDASASSDDVAATTGTIERAPAATAATLLVTSEPPGARVTVNGIGWGETPVTIRHLEFGDKRVRLTLQGYLSQERVVHVGPSQPAARVRLTLRERKES